MIGHGEIEKERRAKVGVTNGRLCFWKPPRVAHANHLDQLYIWYSYLHNFRPRSRSPSPGLFGTTFSSRAKQRDAITSSNPRSRASSVSSPTRQISRVVSNEQLSIYLCSSKTSSAAPKRFRNRSASPTRSIPATARKPSLPRPPSGPNEKLPRSKGDNRNGNKEQLRPVKISTQAQNK